VNIKIDIALTLAELDDMIEAMEDRIMRCGAAELWRLTDLTERLAAKRRTLTASGGETPTGRVTVLP
jgi:hypothetical protein